MGTQAVANGVGSALRNGRHLHQARAVPSTRHKKHPKTLFCACEDNQDGSFLLWVFAPCQELARLVRAPGGGRQNWRSAWSRRYGRHPNPAQGATTDTALRLQLQERFRCAFAQAAEMANGEGRAHEHPAVDESGRGHRGEVLLRCHAALCAQHPNREQTESLEKKLLLRTDSAGPG